MVFDNGAPARALVLPFNPLSKELNDEITTVVIGFNRRHMPLVGGFSNGPGFSDTIHSQMQMKCGVHDVEPCAHRSDGFDWARVNLYATAAAHKTHDGQRFIGRMAHHCGN